MKHTPGPWTAEKTAGGYERIQKDGEIIAWTANQQYIPVKEHEANARLIASAPELLEALIDSKILLESLDLQDRGEIYKDTIAKTIKNAKQAIAKAEGK